MVQEVLEHGDDVCQQETGRLKWWRILDVWPSPYEQSCEMVLRR